MINQSGQPAFGVVRIFAPRPPKLSSRWESGRRCLDRGLLHSHWTLKDSSESFSDYTTPLRTLALPLWIFWRRGTVERDSGARRR
jgi:hypothetical protein